MKGNGTNMNMKDVKLIFRVIWTLKLPKCFFMHIWSYMHTLFLKKERKCIQKANILLSHYEN